LAGCGLALIVYDTLLAVLPPIPFAHTSLPRQSKTQVSAAADPPDLPADAQLFGDAAQLCIDIGFSQNHVLDPIPETKRGMGWAFDTGCATSRARRPNVYL